MNLAVHPKTASAALAELAALAPESRLGALTINPATPNEVRDILIHTCVKGSWDIREHAVVKAHYRRQNILLKPTQMEALHEAWLDPAHFGERYLMAVKRYYELYFVEGESSIHEAQKKGLRAAQRAADQVSAEKLLEACHRVFNR